MNISASFTPSATNPENNGFTNTTPLSGYCATWPVYCPPGAFGIALPLELSLKRPIVANDVPRNNPYFGLSNKSRTIPVVNETTGETSEVTFRVSGFSATYSKVGYDYWWQGGQSFMYPNAPCQYGGPSVGNSVWYAFIWKVTSADGACYKVSTMDRTEPSRFYDMSIAYELKTPDPLKMSSGVYKGTASLTVGPGGNIDFGDVYEASDTMLNINFTLTVTHELKLTPAAGAQTVALQPCPAGKICSEDEGEANWERWMVSRVTPQLTGRSAFTLSSSGGFTVFMDCADQIGNECALTSDNSGQRVPMRVALNLPDNVIDTQTGSTVTGRPLLIGKSDGQNYFSTKAYGADKPGSIDFLVRQQDVDTMLATRPDTYRGAVTVIFDPNIY
ncbi:hypothetical protein PF050_02715 [Kosakonia pseudosacchari]|uniref:hypothetical protein n=1 Tax=Kosakonia pseudosacchari TaxID=1646340 RepID=UPI0022EFF6F9|nr:hypothetical protein [Kosakonia pseudosacchari]WBU49867.1 hypothetical protein PF050_02715 [Kosakonia pseudosacchari]